MTREELEKEAEDYVHNHWTEDEEHDVLIKQAYLAGAELREKRIAELEAQIKKMKCCSNCNHFNKENDIEYCQNCERQLVNSLDNFPLEEIIKDEWELRR